MFAVLCLLDFNVIFKNTIIQSIIPNLRLLVFVINLSGVIIVNILLIARHFCSCFMVKIILNSLKIHNLALDFLFSGQNHWSQVQLGSHSFHPIGLATPVKGIAYDWGRNLKGRICFNYFKRFIERIET